MSGNCPVGELPDRGIVRSRNCPSGKCPSGKCPSGKCPSGKCPSGKCPGFVNTLLQLNALLKLSNSFLGRRKSVDMEFIFSCFQQFYLFSSYFRFSNWRRKQKCQNLD